MAELTVTFHEMLSSSIDEDGVSIPHALILGEDDTLTIVALAMPPAQSYSYLLTQWALKRPKEMIFGFDRFAKPDQGTTLGDLIAGHYLVRGETSRPFVVEYQHEPRIVQPIDWGNAFWNATLVRELGDTIVELGTPR